MTETLLLEGRSDRGGDLLVAGAIEVLERLAKFVGGVSGGESEIRGVAVLRTLAAELGQLPATPQKGAFERLSTSFAFGPLDRRLLILAGLPDEHEGVATVLASMHPHAQPFATCGLAAQLFGPSAEGRQAIRAALTRGPAVRSGALRLSEDQPFFHASLRIAPDLWTTLRGEPEWPIAYGPQPSAAVPSGYRSWLENPDCRRAMNLIQRREPWTISVTGDDLDAAEDRARALVASAGARSLVVRTADRPGPEILAHLVARGAVPIVAVNGEEGEARWPDPLATLAGFPGPIVVAGRSGTVRFPPERRILRLDLDPLTIPERVKLWSGLLPELQEEAAELAAAFSLEPSPASTIALDARALASMERRTVAPRDVRQAVRARARLTGSSAIVLVRPRATWGDLVLPADRAAQLREAVARLRNQGTVLDRWGFLGGRRGARGVRILLSGPPGTGKTLSAEVLAHTIGVDLLVVDLSKLVSKWLGETEKHLSEVFEAAERAQAVLLFDEADALFGRRTEVSDAHDRYANLETAYLLYRLERFDGLAVLSTNLQRNLDPAFLRRLEFAIELGEPDFEARLELWRRHLPPEAPIADDVDLPQLATLFPIVGALIRNAASAAAFLAAEAGTPITRGLILHAVRREYQKAGREFPGLPPGMNPG